MRITPEEADALGRKIGAAMAKAAPRAVPSRKEREIQAAILSYLRTVPGVVVWRQNVAAVKTGERFIRFGFKGLSDIVGWRTQKLGCRMCTSAASGGSCTCPGSDQARFLAIECKREGHFPTAEQQHFLELVHAAGGIAIVARNVEDVRRVLQP